MGCFGFFISIHALLAESDDTVVQASDGAGVFLSTLSLRRATEVKTLIATAENDFYPRSPCGERPSGPHWPLPQSAFLSTLSLRRATQHQFESKHQQRHFYPRSPCGERPRAGAGRTNQGCISIHALLAESDVLANSWRSWWAVFLSTLSLRRATWALIPLPMMCRYFYPRSPCGERLPHFCLWPPDHSHFYPRSPCGERLHRQLYTR